MTRDKQILDSELASLADGSISAERRREIEDRLHESDAAREAIAKQRIAIDVVRGAEADAPDSLHRAVVDMVQPKRKRSRVPMFAGATAALAAAVIAVAVISGGGGGVQPQIDAAAQLAQAGPQLPAPSESEKDGRWLNLKVGDIAFPYWEDDHGWKSTGARSDDFEGRTAKTVFYRDGTNRNVAYTIVGGTALEKSGTKAIADNGTKYWYSERDGVRRVVWTRGGHTCILTARDVATSDLQTLID
jgi:hypothetical protein